MLRLIVILAAFASANVHACKCMHLSVPELYATSQSVFVATLAPGTPLPKKEGDLVNVRIVRSLKGSRVAGSVVKIDPVAGSDCEVRFCTGLYLLVFASAQDQSPVVVSTCSVRLAQPFWDGKQLHKPSHDIVKLLVSKPN